MSSDVKKMLADSLRNHGVLFNGQNPWDPQIHNEKVFNRILEQGYLGVGESFMDEDWDVERLDELVARVHSNDVGWENIFSSGLFLHWLKSKIFNMQKGEKAYDVGQKHYDLGNDLYEVMLDKRMIYTCGYWEEGDDLVSAQEKKMDMIIEQLDLREGDHVLDIGCGWGGLMKYMTQKKNISCVGLTVSKEQAVYARKKCDGLPIEIIVEDYNKYVPEKSFDKIVSIEMIEAVGQKNFRIYMKKVHSWLVPQGRFFLQSIGSTAPKTVSDPWLDKYIFPNGILPSKSQLEKSMKGLFDVMQWQNIGKHYDPTLMAWWNNFVKGYELLDHKKYDKRFYRMWKYYLQSCAGGFRSGNWEDWQILLMRK